MKNINGLNVLETSDFTRLCPSFYATAPVAKASDQYAFINTRDIALQLWKEGWMPVYAKEQRSNKRENRGFTKHVVRWAHKDYRTSDGDRIEIVGTNSHNLSARFNFMAGIFRLVCSNGLIIQTANMGSFSVIHKGDIVEQVQEAVSGIAANAAKVSARIDDMKSIELSPEEMNLFALSAHKYVYGEETDKAPVAPVKLLSTRRSVDAKSDLWTVYNRVQENVIKGGLRDYRRSRRSTRRITSITKDVKLNQALWTLAEGMINLKRAA